MLSPNVRWAMEEFQFGTVDPTDIQVQAPPPNKSRLQVTAEFVIYFPYDPPNAWWRFWQWLFFGFRWKKLDGEKE